MNLGTLIRKYRKEKNMTLRAVAELASISEGFLSQVENCVNSPSVDTLVRICDALGVHAGDLLSQIDRQTRIVVVKKEDWNEFESSRHGFVTRRFFPPEYRNVIDSAVIVLEPGRSLPVRKKLKNAQEVLCVLQGSVELLFGDDTYTLHAGDTTHYWSNPARQMIYNTSKEQSVVLWVGTT